MKKTNLFFKAIVICAITLFGINSANAQIRFGVIAGANFANQGGDAETDGMMIGGHIGPLFNFSLSDNIKVEPQVLFSMQGAKYKQDIPFFGTLEYDLKLNYINVPIWLRYQTEGGFNVQAGPYVGILLSAKSDDEDVKDGFNSLDYGIGGGIGYQMGSGLGFAANYSVGLANIADDSDDDYKVTNTLIRLSINYTLGGD
jgi:hypothetical protein